MTANRITEVFRELQSVFHAVGAFVWLWPAYDSEKDPAFPIVLGVEKVQPVVVRYFALVVEQLIALGQRQVGVAFASRYVQRWHEMDGEIVQLAIDRDVDVLFQRLPNISLVQQPLTLDLQRLYFRPPILQLPRAHLLQFRPIQLIQEQLLLRVFPIYAT